jgi:hypothetical protein
MQTCLSKSRLDVSLKVLPVQPFPFYIVRKILNEHRNVCESA